MSFILQPSWTRQPQGPVEIDWSNPLTRGLVICTHAGNNFREMVTNKPSTITSATYAPTKEGRALMDSASTFRIDTGVTANFGDAVTWMFGAQLDTFPVNASRFAERVQVEVFLIDSSGRLNFQRSNTTPTVSQNFLGSTGQTAPAPYSTYAARVSSFTSNADAALFVNGLSLTLTTNTAGSGTLNTNANSHLLCNRGDSTRPLDGRIYFAYRWNRALSNNEIKRISDNPYQIFKPVTRTIALSGAVVQLLRPDGDISSGAWLPSTGSDLYAMLDETTADDGDYIYTTSASTAEVSLTNAGDPAVSTGHIIRYRAKGTGTLTVKLMQGTTTIATHVPTLTTSFQTFTFTLSGAEADSITDYSNLRLQFVSS